MSNLVNKLIDASFADNLITRFISFCIGYSTLGPLPDSARLYH